MNFISVKIVHEKNDTYLQKKKYFSNNILGVPHEIIISECNEYDFLKPI